MPHNPFFAWCVRYYNDTKGNIKYALLIVVLSGLMAAFRFVVGGLEWWRYALIVFFFSLVSIWAAVATWTTHKHRTNAQLEFDSQLAKLRVDLEEAKEQIPSIAMNGIPLVGPAAFRAEKERLAAASQPVGALLTSLQIEAIQLAKDLRDFLKELGEPPFVDGSKFPLTSDGIVEHIMENHRVVEPWYEEVRAKYALDFAGRVETVRNRFAAQRLSSDALNVEIRGIDGPKLIAAMVTDLWELASKDDKPQ